jgi:hypothetical protein
VGRDFFKVFSYPLVAGDKNQVLTEKAAIVISRALAIKLFGSVHDCLGKSLDFDLGPFGGNHIITGIFESPGTNSSVQFDFVLTYEQFLDRNQMDATWDSNPIMTYITLKPSVDVLAFDKKLDTFYKSKRPDEDYGDMQVMFMQRYSERYLYDHFENGKQAGGRIEYLILFSTIAVFIMVIACINFMNLATARASRRVKEVGIKKAIGVRRAVLVMQHLGESVTMACIAFVVAGLLIYVLLPSFNTVTNKQLHIDGDIVKVLGAFAIVLMVGLLAGSYPAFYLSRFRPVEVLKGKLTIPFGDVWIRRGLVVFQFTVSVLLFIAVIVVTRQIDFVQRKNLGFNKAHVLLFEKQGPMANNLEGFLAEVKRLPTVVNATCSSEIVVNVNSTSWGHDWDGKVEGLEEVEFTGLNVGFDFFETMGIDVISGRPFSPLFGKEETTVLLNEAAVAAMAITDPIGKWIQLFNVRREIVGVAKDFHFRPLREKIKPIFIVCNPR